MFVSDERVVVFQRPNGQIEALEEGAFRALRNSLPAHEQEEIDSIWIPSKMGFKRRKVLQDALMQMSTTVAAGAAEGDAPGAERAASTEIAYSLGNYHVALLEHNILKWDGPSFRGVALTQANIHRLDPDEPLLSAVIGEIGRRNPAGGTASPKSSTSAGAPASPVADAAPSVPTT